jgi:hypothetical protein
MTTLTTSLTWVLTFTHPATTLYFQLWYTESEHFATSTACMMNWSFWRWHSCRMATATDIFSELVIQQWGLLHPVTIQVLMFFFTLFWVDFSHIGRVLSWHTKPVGPYQGKSLASIQWMITWDWVQCNCTVFPISVVGPELDRQIIRLTPEWGSTISVYS